MIKFLGGLGLTIPLILLTLILVAIATVLEGQTGSHALAEGWVYHHPFFYFLLSLYFVNILFSTFTRWPFKKGHFPFLITHLGLLMVIAGVAIKGFFGVQGVIRLHEGEGSHLMLLPKTQGLFGRNGQWRFSFPTQVGVPFQEGDLVYTPLKIFPHGEGRWSRQADQILMLDNGRAGYAVEEKGKLVPISFEVAPLDHPLKEEESRPVLHLQVKKGVEVIEKQLLYDSPIFEPAFGALLKFQPLVARVPNHLHLHQAKTIFRPGTTIPEAYVASITVDGEPFNLLMNQVFESKQGYRYYLSTIEGGPTEVKEVQLAVNYDPAKYPLTYPGALLIVIGSILLLFKKKPPTPSTTLS